MNFKPILKADVTFISPWTQNSLARPYWVLEDPSGQQFTNQESNA